MSEKLDKLKKLIKKYGSVMREKLENQYDNAQVNGCVDKFEAQLESYAEAYQHSLVGSGPIGAPIIGGSYLGNPSGMVNVADILGELGTASLTSQKDHTNIQDVLGDMVVNGTDEVKAFVKKAVDDGNDVFPRRPPTLTPY